ncbi:hypothetical protein EDD21DRAFT_363505 [Dissophora ornata]|nr:hypothetical protein EDD21DRAFT_363505 [Dissophora ornata]
MSSSRRRQSMRSNIAPLLPTANVLSGAEMLVLQQNIKQYIITRQTRPLTSHELEEFGKIKDLLLPNLLRYSQAAGPSLTKAATAFRGSNNSGSSGNSKSGKVAPLQSNGRAAPSQITPKLQSTTLLVRPLDEADSHKLPISNKSKIKTTSKLKRVTVKQEPLDLSNGPNMAQSSSQAGVNSARTLVANAVKKGINKRSKIEVYQDPEDVQQKRPRLKKHRANADDPGKENLDPLDNISSKTAKKVLQDSTNTVNNTAKTAELKDKEAVRDSDSRKTSARSMALVESKITPSAQQRQQTNSYPITSSSTTAVAENTTRRTKQIPVVRNPSQSRIAVVSRGTELPSEDEDVLTQRQGQITRDPVLSETDRATKNSSERVVKIEPEDDFGKENIATQCKTKLEPESATNALLRDANVIEILASVDDDESTDSFATYIKAERSTQSVSVAPSRVVDAYDDVQENQSSQGSKDLYSPRGSLEETFPMPDFLFHELPDDAQDELTFPMPDFLSPRDLPEDSHRKADGLEPALDEDSAGEFQTEIDAEDGVLESTNFVDGVWCIDEFKNRVNSTVCSHQERWIAVETTSHVQLWQLSDPDDLCESKWCRRIQLDKISKHPIQVMFAPNDSFAVVLSPMESTLIKISLEDAECSMTSSQKITWSVATPLTNCGGLIVKRKTIAGTTQAEPDNTSFQLVFGTDEPGSICLIPIPDIDRRVSETNVLTEKLHYPRTNEIVSSVARVSNTPSLILASFGPALVMW